jgi:uncharacterized protein with beta-barrel porin domain
VADTSAASLRVSTGLRAARTLGAPSGHAFHPRGELGYLRELRQPFAETQAAFADAPSIPFTVRSQSVGLNAAAVSGGILIGVSGRTTISADYHGLFTALDHRQLFTLGVGF